MGKNNKNKKNCHKVLGVAADASRKTLKEAYLRLSKKYHPDKQNQENQEGIDKATAKFKEIKNAYQQALDEYDMINSEEEEEDYDYEQHMWKRGQQQSYFSFGVSESKEIIPQETKVAQEVAIPEAQVDEDEEIERRAQEQVEEFFAYEQRGIEKMKAKHNELVKDEQVKGIDVNLKQGLRKFCIKQKYEEYEHELVAGCRSCNKWFKGIEGYLSHLHSDSHKKKSDMPRFSRKYNGMLKITYDTLSLSQRQDPSRWHELSQEVQHQIEATVSQVQGAYPTITENIEETKSEAVCEYVKNHSSDIDPDLIIKCSATAFYCNVEFNSVADYYRHHRTNVEEEDYYRHHRTNVEEEEINSDNDTELLDN